jgi:hypothetical protein
MVLKPNLNKKTALFQNRSFMSDQLTPKPGKIFDPKCDPNGLMLIVEYQENVCSPGITITTFITNAIWLKQVMLMSRRFSQIWFACPGGSRIRNKYSGQ